MSNPPPAERIAERKPLMLAAKCRTMAGIRDDGMLADISIRGCCITTQRLLLNVGTRVVIKPESIEGISGIVRWISGSRAGIEFDEPLYGPVVEFLSKRGLLCEPTAYVRRFARGRR